MNDCPTCGFPMVWSEWLRRTRCCVYGDNHEAPRTAIGGKFRWVAARQRWESTGEVAA